MRRILSTAVALFAPLLLLIAGCNVATAPVTAIPGATPTTAVTPTGLAATTPGEVALGTWGGADVALIHETTRAHMHWGCVQGEIELPLTVDAQGNFDFKGTYNPQSFPVTQDVALPARYSGQIAGNTMTITVTDSQSGATFGPFALVLGQIPQMKNCPICVPSEGPMPMPTQQP